MTGARCRAAGHLIAVGRAGGESSQRPARYATILDGRTDRPTRGLGIQSRRVRRAVPADIALWRPCGRTDDADDDGGGGEHTPSLGRIHDAPLHAPFP